MDAESQSVAAETAADRVPPTAPPDRTPEADADGLNGAITALLSRRGIIPAKAAAASAEAQPNAEADDLSQSPSTDTAAGEAADDSAEASGDQVDPEADAGDEAGDDGSESTRVQKRINKLTAKAKSAEEKAARLEAELAKLKSGSPEAPVGEDAELKPLLDAQRTYQGEIQLATELRAKLSQSPEEVAAVIRKVANLPNYDPETLRDFLNDYIADAKLSLGKTEGKISVRKEKREQEAGQRRERVLSMANAEMPWLKDESDPRTERFRELMQDPVVRSSPDAAFFVACGLERLAQMEARSKVQKPAAAAPAARQTVRPPSPGRGAPAKVEAKSKLDVARQELGKGDRAGLLAYARAAVAAADS